MRGITSRQALREGAERLLLTGILVGTGVVVPAPSGAQEADSVAHATAALTGVVRGRFQGGVRTLPYAIVSASSSTGLHRTVADGAGRYHLEGLPVGPLALRATHAGHATGCLTLRFDTDEPMLVELAKRLRRIAGRSDLIARLDHKAFAIQLIDQDSQQIQKRAVTLINELTYDASCPALCIGMSLSETGQTTLAQLIDAAEVSPTSDIQSLMPTLA